MTSSGVLEVPHRGRATRELELTDVALPVAVAGGLSAAHTLQTTSRAMRRAVGDVFAAVLEAIPSRIYVCGGLPFLEEGCGGVECFNTASSAWEPAPRCATSGFVVAATLRGQVYLCGGGCDEGGTAIGSLARLGVDGGSWEALPPAACRFGMASAVVSDVLYLCGGCGEDGETLRTAARFDPRLGAWKDLPLMAHARAFAAAVALGGALYVCCGRNDNDDVCSEEAVAVVERFEPGDDTWSTLPPLTLPRVGAAVATLGSTIYVCGGCCGPSYYAGVESLDVFAGGAAWRARPDMAAKRADSAVATFKQGLFVFGGEDGRTQLDSAECFSEAVGAWEALPSMPLRRASATASIVLGQVYIFGGFRDVQTPLCFDLRSHAWSSLPPMAVERAGASVAVLRTA